MNNLYQGLMFTWDKPQTGIYAQGQFRIISNKHQGTIMSCHFASEKETALIEFLEKPVTTLTKELLQNIINKLSLSTKMNLYKKGNFKWIQESSGRILVEKENKEFHIASDEEVHLVMLLSRYFD